MIKVCCWCCQENVNNIWLPGLHRLALHALFSTSWASHLTRVIQLWVDLSRIPVNKGIKSRHGWTKYSDLYEIVHPSLNLIFFMFGYWCGMWERSVRQESYDFCVSPSSLSFSHFMPEVSQMVFMPNIRYKSCYYLLILLPKKAVIFTCRYFNLSWNTTALSQSNCRNFSFLMLVIREKATVLEGPWSANVVLGPGQR